MQVSVVERSGNISDAVKTYAREKASRLVRFYDRMTAIEVIIGNQAQKFEVEMIARVDHRQTFVASELHDDVFASVDLVVDKLERQLTRHKEKLRNRKHPDSA